MVTIKDIEKHTGISMATISRAIRNPSSVSADKLKIINEAIDELGYVPNYYARNLKGKRGSNIGLIVNDVQNPFFNSLIRSIETYLENEKLRLLISFGLSESDNIEDKIKNFIASGVSGIMFSPNTINKNNIENLLNKNSIYALQLFTKVYDDIDSVLVDDFYGTYLATKRLIMAGHKNIMIIGFDDMACKQRINGYREALTEHKININEKNIILIKNNDLLLEKICTKIVSNNPTAIITISDAINTKTVKALSKLSLKIYDDISLVLYDDSSWADLMNITAIGHQINKLGQEIADTLISGISEKNKRPPIHKVIDPIIIERNSIRDINNE
ncbi:MAG: LacI family DNA-binding transcriptional regulator [Acholeplasmataceae bacterium]|jgi:DNA-binding LacI/PurR family transcriptional regulator